MQCTMQEALLMSWHDSSLCIGMHICLHLLQVQVLCPQHGCGGAHLYAAAKGGSMLVLGDEVHEVCSVTSMTAYGVASACTK